MERVAFDDGTCDGMFNGMAFVVVTIGVFLLAPVVTVMGASRKKWRIGSDTGVESATGAMIVASVQPLWR